MSAFNRTIGAVIMLAALIGFSLAMGWSLRELLLLAALVGASLSDWAVLFTGVLLLMTGKWPWQ